MVWMYVTYCITKLHHGQKDKGIGRDNLDIVQHEKITGARTNHVIGVQKGVDVVRVLDAAVTSAD